MFLATLGVIPDTYPNRARARGVDVDAHAVDDVFHHVAQGAREFGLVKVVLVLANADGLGRNLGRALPVGLAGGGPGSWRHAR